MAPFAGFLVDHCWELPVGFRRHNWGDATAHQVIAQPIRIESSVRGSVIAHRGLIGTLRVKAAPRFAISNQKSDDLGTLNVNSLQLISR